MSMVYLQTGPSSLCSQTFTTATVDPTWIYWANSTGASSTTTNVWTTWVVNPSSIYYQNQVQVMPCAQLTEAQRLELQTQPVVAGRRRQEQEKIRQEAEQKRKIAAEVAMHLLKANLDKKQQQALDKHGWFLVEGGKSKKTYRIHGDRCAGNIQELEGERAVATYCVHAEDYRIPLGDNLLAQALCLKYDEDHIISKANKTALAA